MAHKLANMITGEKFCTIADHIFSPNIDVGVEDYNPLKNTYNPYNIKDGDIIYSHTMYAQLLLDAVGGLSKKVILITHNGDINIGNSFSVPDNVFKWFSQNVNVFHEKIESIPIGLENDRWFKDIHKKEKMIAKLQEPRKYKNLVYMNHNIATNPSKRLEPYRILEGKSWVTTDRGTNGQRFDEYLDNIYNHKFVVCPEGNGIDTHRIWETLYMDSIPIVGDNITAELLYTYFPCIVTHEGWEGLDDISLNWEFYHLNKIKSTTDVHNEMLTFKYWENRILNDRRTITGQAR